MNIEQIYTKCLAQGAYFIESDGVAAVIDPLRDIEPYLNSAAETGAQIKYIFETHFHADFVSGHLELAARTGATIVFGPGAVTAFDAYIAADNEVFQLGKLKIKTIHTPGHTLESTCYLLQNNANEDVALFSGDTLFIGDVGRPDLAQQPQGGGLSKEMLAGMLFDSLHGRILNLPDHVVVYPAHGAGSACGKNMSKETFDTLGHQKLVNYALSPVLSRENFITQLTAGLDTPPPYFPMNIRLNKEGYASVEGVLDNGLRALSVMEFEEMMDQPRIIVLDTRNAEDFAACHIPGAVNIGIEGSFAPWVGTVLPIEDSTLLLVTDAGKEKEVITRLARVGFDRTAGYLSGGIAAWVTAGKEWATIPTITPGQLLEDLSTRDLAIIDVRNAGEFQSGHINNAEHIPLAEFEQALSFIKPGNTYYVYCAGGYRSMIFISLMKSMGEIEMININGGFNALKNLNHA